MRAARRAAGGPAHPALPAARVLGTETIRSEPAGYRLAVEPHVIDAARYEALLTRAARAPCREALGLHDSARALWRGPAYAEFADRDFVRADAVRLDELRLCGVEDRAVLLLELSDIEAAVAALEPFCGEHPLRERARGQLMTALYRAGRAAEALDRYRDHAGYLADELGLEPSPALRELRERILRHELAGVPEVPAFGPAPAAAPAWLVTDAAFVGRDDEAADLVAVATEHRLVTVTGIGGVGKTRLAAEVLPALTGALGLTAVVVELAGVDAGGVEVGVAAALDVGPAGGDVGEAMYEYLSVTPRLLVLDNCEHVMDGVQRFAAAVLRRCPAVRMVATSRRRIGLTAEQVLALEPLGVPAPGVDPGTAELTPAMRLFVDRVRRVRPSFPLTAGALQAAAELCRSLDGLPLAIELAATRAATLGVVPLRARLDQGLDLLAADGPRGERSLRATLDWSYGLLGEPERALFAALGVFEDDVDLDGVERVAEPLGIPSAALALSELTEASLVAARHSAGGPRYRLLEIVRAFARERLAETGTEHDVRLAHALWVPSLVQDAAVAATGPGGAAASARLDAEVASIRAAASWALRAGEVALAGEITGPLVLAAVHGQLRLDLIDVVGRVADDPSAGPLARGAGAFAALFQGTWAPPSRARGLRSPTPARSTSATWHCARSRSSPSTVESSTARGAGSGSC